MEPIGNEPQGWAENEERHTTNFNTSGTSNDHLEKHRETDQNDNDLAGVAAGNTPDDWEETQLNDQLETDDPRGFMGDYTEPQHDED